MECKHGTDLDDSDCMNCENDAEEISCIIADKFPEFFDMEGENYDVLHRLEELSKELSSRTDT